MKTLDIPTLQRIITDIDRFERDLQEAIKDEKDAQIMYAKIVQSAEALGRSIPDSVFGSKTYPNYMVESSRTTQEIIREESIHERKFSAICTGIINLKQRAQDQLRQLIADEQRKKSQTPEGYYGPYKLRR